MSPVLAPTEVAEHPHTRHRNVVATVNGVLQATPAPSFPAHPAALGVPVHPGGDDFDDGARLLVVTAGRGGPGSPAPGGWGHTRRMGRDPAIARSLVQRLEPIHVVTYFAPEARPRSTMLAIAASGWGTSPAAPLHSARSARTSCRRCSTTSRRREWRSDSRRMGLRPAQRRSHRRAPRVPSPRCADRSERGWRRRRLNGCRSRLTSGEACPGRRPRPVRRQPRAALAGRADRSPVARGDAASRAPRRRSRRHLAGRRHHRS